MSGNITVKPSKSISSEKKTTIRVLWELVGGGLGVAVWSCAAGEVDSTCP